jgi:hypothetical protein
MPRHTVDWVLCPVCKAGSPAGVSTCPRCRYRFPSAARPDARHSNPAHPPEFRPTIEEAANGSTVRDLLVGALCGVLALAGVGAVQGAIVRYKECSATADALDSAIIIAVFYLLQLGIHALVIGAILGWVLGRLGRYASRFRAAKPKAGTDDLA